MHRSRLTFRDAQTHVAWQRQLRDRFASEPAPPVPHLDVRRALIRRVSRRSAEQIILRYEWLGTMAQTGWHYGIFFGPFCAGVCCIAAGGGTGGVGSHLPFGIERSEFATLARGACVHWAPSGTNSRLVSWTARLFARDSGCKILIAYADTDAGEIGTIYQACGWTYIGRGARTEQWVSPRGRVYDAKLPYDLARRSRGKRRSDYTQKLRDAGWRTQLSNPKHRYVCILDRSDELLVARVRAMSLPYPKRKRAGSIDSDAPDDQSGEAGSSPSSALRSVLLSSSE